MTVLSDGEIVEELEEGELDIEGMLDRELQVQPSTVDLRLGDSYLKYRSDITHVDPAKHDHENLVEAVVDADKIIVKPGDFVLGTTIETLKVPDDIQGKVDGRSSYGRFGIEVHSTAGLIDPGWDGQITLEISNNTQRVIVLTPGKRICQISFLRMGREAERPYGSRSDSKYQNQKGATASKAHEDT